MSRRSFSEIEYDSRKQRTYLRTSARLPLWLLNSSFCFFTTSGDRLKAPAVPFKSLVMAPQKRWTAERSGCSVSRMVKLLALGICIALPIWAQAQDEQGTAYEALRIVGAERGR